MNIKNLENLVMAYGPSGHEELAKKVFIEELKPHADKIEDIAEHNCYVFGKEKESNPIVYLSAHIDEVGFTVTYINEQGMVYFAPLDTNILDVTAMRAKKMLILHRGELVKGVVGHPPSHCLPWESGQKIDWRHVWLDIGAENKKEAEKMVSIGDPIVVERGFDVLNKKYVVSGALDNRVSVYVLMEGFKRFVKKAKNINLIAGAHIQEEIDQRGGQMAAYLFKPDLNVVIDTVFALDHPLVEYQNIGEVKLNGGPVIVWNNCLNRKMTQFLKETAQKKKIKIQEIAWGGKFPTDAFHMSKSHHGLKTVFIGIPLRYMHTNGEMIALSDLQNAENLLVAFLEELNKNHESVK